MLKLEAAGKCAEWTLKLTHLCGARGVANMSMRALYMCYRLSFSPLCGATGDRGWSEGPRTALSRGPRHTAVQQQHVGSADGCDNRRLLHSELRVT